MTRSTHLVLPDAEDIWAGPHTLIESNANVVSLLIKVMVC